jgi:hypothetical protein
MVWDADSIKKKCGRVGELVSWLPLKKLIFTTAYSSRGAIST